MALKTATCGRRRLRKQPQTEDHAEPEDADEVLWDDDNVQYTEEEWGKLFGESDDEGDSNYNFEGF